MNVVQMLMHTVTTHQEKITFLTNFLRNVQEGFDNSQPLMILGSGANGKSYVLQEVAQTSPVNICLLVTDQGYHYIPASQPSNKCVLLFLVNGAQDDFTLARILNASIVQFEKDPAYQTSA